MTEVKHNAFSDLWDAFEFCATEALILRSFLEYLRSWPDPPEKKWQRIQNWKAEIGLQLGNPALIEWTKQVAQKLRAAPPEARALVLEEVLNQAHANYFGNSPS